MLEIAWNAKKTWNFEEFFFQIYIDSHCPYLLFGETTSHLTIKWRGTFSIVFFFNVENSIKCKMRKNYSSKFFFSTPPPKKYFFTPPPPPQKYFFTPPPPECIFLHKYFFLNVGNSMKRLENMKFGKNKVQILFFLIFKKFITNSNNIPSISKTIQHTPITWCTYL